eukprot:5065784-Amphidinium_carterae.1
MLKSQLEAEKANVEQIVSRHLHSEREKMARDVQAMPRHPVEPRTRSQQFGTPPGLVKIDDVDEPAPQTPENRRTQHSSSLPTFGLLANMDGSRGSGSNGMGA